MTWQKIKDPPEALTFGGSFFALVEVVLFEKEKGKLAILFAVII